MSAKRKTKGLCDFSKLTPEEQREVSRKMIQENNGATPVNETIAQAAKIRLDQFRSRHIQ